MNTQRDYERDYERDYQATLPQGRTAADGCKPRHGRGDRKRERSFSGLSRERGNRNKKEHIPTADMPSRKADADAALQKPN